MISVLSNPAFRALFAAQCVALIGTGLATVALGLLAYDLAGDRAGLVLGAVFTIKMVAYVGIGPVAGGFADLLPRRALLVTLDVVRAGVALCLPFVTEIWQVYVLIFVLQSASAAFTPTFQAAIPDILPDEREYTRALSLSRLAYDIENILSPILAAVLLAFVSYQTLFLGTVLGFAGSALLILSILLPAAKTAHRKGVWDRTTRGIRIYLATPRLRGLLALNFAVAAGGAMVLVNTIVLVRAVLDGGAPQVAWALGAFGAGSMIAALALPRLLDRSPDRPVMFIGGILLVLVLLGMAVINVVWGFSLGLLFIGWVGIGLGYSAVLTPSGRLLRRSSHEQDRAAVFAAQFALSHACWLVTYPLAGILMTYLGLAPTLFILAGLTVLGVGAARYFWPAETRQPVEHTHDDLPPDHPHLRGHGSHSHPIIVDDYHPHWRG